MARYLEPLSIEQLEGRYTVLLAGRASAGEGSKSLHAVIDIASGWSTYFEVYVKSTMKHQVYSLAEAIRKYNEEGLS